VEKINWNDASKLGLIYRINKEILHPLGLAMTRDPQTGSSESLLISEDGEWHYSDEINAHQYIASNEEIKEFTNNILKSKIS